MDNKVQLIAYADRFGADLNELNGLLNNELSGVFGGIHILPFYDPIDGADAGFDPSNHRKVDHRLGSWDDVRAISESTPVMADLIVNHVSSSSPQFLDVLENGEESKYWPLFLRLDDAFDASCSCADREEQIKKIYRPRPGQPFTSITLNNGHEVRFWATFNPEQLDINVEHTLGREYLESILQKFAESGVRRIRLDAVGFAIKRPGTSCFMLPETFDLIEELDQRAAKDDMDVLVEIHGHHQTQIEIASRVSWVYDFALPPLVLHAFEATDAGPLKKWLAIAPRNCISVLDTHDGIGIVDVAGNAERPGLLTDDQIDQLVESIHRNSKGESRLASGESASNVDIYQVNCTYYDALGRDDVAYLLARTIQLFSPGIPQIYYVGLLAGENDTQLLAKTQVGRDINRRYYQLEDIRRRLEKPVVNMLIDLIHLRNSLGSMMDDFTIVDSSDDQLVMKWLSDQGCLTIDINFGAAVGEIRVEQTNSLKRFEIPGALERQ